MTMKSDSIYPADIAKRAAVKWGHTHLRLCPTCHGPALVGYLDGDPVAFACHRCGPIHQPLDAKPIAVAS